MAYIPNDAEWYLADLIIEIRVEDDARSVVHINTVLVNASSPNEAYDKALQLGEQQVGEPYLNPIGKRVETRFVGLKDLSVIYEKLEHGAELFFVERTGLAPEDVFSMTQPKQALSVFADIEPSTGPDYSSGKIAEDFGKESG
jgi:hypothetical protein